MEETARSASRLTAASAAPSVSPVPDEAPPTPPDAPPAPHDVSPGPKARQSTGPRTPYGKRRSSRNALRHGRYAEGGRSYVESVWYSMVDLGEDPTEFAHLRSDLLESHRPTTPAQVMLVDDIASLRWQRRRNERAQAALLVRNLERMEAQRTKRALETQNVLGADALRGEVFEKGLLHAEDTPTKFAELLQWLESLDRMAQERQFGEAGPTLRAVYGKDPTLRGAYIRGLFEDLAPAGPSGPSGEEQSDKYKLLRLTLAEEIRNVTEAYRLYLAEHVEVTRAMREECLAPVDAGKWRFLLRQELGLDRQIERKTRLVLAMQKADREAEEAEREQTEKLEALATPPK